MKRLVSLICALAFCALPVISQTSSDTSETQEDDINSEAKYKMMNQKGDQYIRVGLAPSVPLNFPNVASLFQKDQHQLSIGGMGSIGYRYFLTPLLAVGGEIGFGFNVTIGSNIFNYVPILAGITFQPAFRDLEFPISLNAGIAWETYAGYNYFPALVVRPEAGVHYRITPSWSAGMDISYSFMPQFMSLYEDGAENYFGHFLNLSVVARYYF